MSSVFTQEQLDEIREIAKRYEKLFIREFSNLCNPDNPFWKLNAHELIQFTKAGTEAVLNQWLEKKELNNRFTTEVNIDVKYKTRDITFDVCFCTIHSNVENIINILTDVANRKAGVTNGNPE